MCGGWWMQQPVEISREAFRQRCDSRRRAGKKNFVRSIPSKLPAVTIDAKHPPIMRFSRSCRRWRGSIFVPLSSVSAAAIIQLLRLESVCIARATVLFPAAAAANSWTKSSSFIEFPRRRQTPSHPPSSSRFSAHARSASTGIRLASPSRACHALSLLSTISLRDLRLGQIRDRFAIVLGAKLLRVAARSWLSLYKQGG